MSQRKNLEGYAYLLYTRATNLGHQRFNGLDEEALLASIRLAESQLPNSVIMECKLLIGLA